MSLTLSLGRFVSFSTDSVSFPGANLSGMPKLSDTGSQGYKSAEERGKEKEGRKLRWDIQKNREKGGNPRQHGRPSLSPSGTVGAEQMEGTRGVAKRQATVLGYARPWPGEAPSSLASQPGNPAEAILPHL